jgi:hypothetical protein
MASMPRKAIAPAIPAPATTVGYEAAPVAGMSVPEGEPPVVVSVAEETVLMTVELEPMVEALMDAPVPAAVVIAVPEETTTVDVATALVDVTTAVELADEVASAVVEATAATG